MTFVLPKQGKDVSLVICGSAGQGLATFERLLTRIMNLSGYSIFSSKEYMSRIRGGCNSTQIRISNGAVHAPIDRIDLLLPLDRGSAERLMDRVTDNTLIISDASFTGEGLRAKSGGFIELDFVGTAKQLGSNLYSNQIVLGLVARLFGVDSAITDKELSAFFMDKGPVITNANIKAVQAGYDMGAGLMAHGEVTLSMKKPAQGLNDILVNGAQAMALGAIAGGCDFIAAYPMSPSTGLFAFLSKHSERFDIVAEQCEDEIAGINMALGAWYAGSRALASTSGGGFALMEEGISLSAMIESPVVVHIAQRPGPATGLPTRTEQGDLELALYSGHGEFPRIILAPGSTSEAFYLTQKAFNLADRYQVPVFILTDQYLVDSLVNTTPFDLDGLDIETHITKTEKGYKRYAITDTGVSPRGIPGYGDGLVAVDSDEHDEDGRITEDMDIRVKMVDKRLRKLELIKRHTIEPTLVGDRGARTVILAWGSTLEIVREALDILDKPGLLFIHNAQVYPLSPVTVEYIKGAKKIAVIEGNAIGQFSRLIKTETGREVDEKILKYNGLQFCVEELVERIGAL